MKKKMLLILLFLVGVSVIGGGKIYAAEMNQETSIYFENSYTPEPDIPNIPDAPDGGGSLTPGISTKPDAPNSNQKFPQTGEKGLDKRIFSLGIVLLCLGTISIVIKMSARFFYKKKKIEEESLNMKVSKLALVGILSSSVLAGGAQISYAVDVDTIGDVIFKEDLSITPPIDPVDPSNPIVPVDPEYPGGTAGPLSIDYVSNFHFGEQKITGDTKTYNVELGDDFGDEVVRPMFVQVTDNRGTNTGWKLTVQQDAQFSTKVDTDDVELKGAKLSMSNLTIVKTGDNTNTTAPKPNTSKITLVPGDGTDPGAAQDVMTAETDKGMSTWINTFGTADNGAESVTLEVPGTSTKVKDSKYTTTLTWVLSDTEV